MIMVRLNKIGLLALSGVVMLSVMLALPVMAKEAGEQIVCIDPGHQQYGNNAQEPVAPNSKETKAKVASGTRGVKTKKPEYVLTLEASLLLKEKLERFGYKVVMTREAHDVDISNAERAQVCNNVQADLSVRIHADGDSSSKTQGISVLYPGWSEATGSFYSQSKEAASLVLKEAVAATEAVSRGTVARSDLSGFNWSTVSSILVEMGFMTNPQEDEKLSDSGYLNALTEGVATGINLALAAPADEPEAKEPFAISLPATTQLYERSNGKMVRTQFALSPQAIQVTAVAGSWGRVQTWVGELWVHLGDAPSL